MEMDSTLFDQCSNEYRERQEALEEKKKAQQEVWDIITSLAMKQPSYKAKEKILYPNTDLTYAMRAQQSNAEANGLSASFKGLSLNPTSDQLATKRALVSKEKEGMSGGN